MLSGRWIICLRFSLQSTELNLFPSLFLEAILESCGALQQLVPGLEGQIVSQVVNRASQGLEAAKNIPRLYRRTNKEVTDYSAES